MATDETTSEAVEGSWSPKRPRTAAEQRAGRHAGTTDPQVLADDIEKTREELAETLDAIADKVNPKKAARRTTRKVGDAAKEGVHDAAEVVKDMTSTATEAVKEAVGTAKEKVAGTTDSTSVSSPLEPATSAEVSSAARVAGEPATATLLTADAAHSPLPTDTLSVDAGPLPPAEPLGASRLDDLPPADTTGSLADAAERVTPTVEPAGADLPPYRPTLLPPAVPSRAPVYAGAAAAVTVLLLVLRRRRR